MTRGDAHEPSHVEQELGEFSYVVAHDLAAPLRHVKGFLNLLAGDLEGELTERQYALFDRIDRAAGKGEALLAEIGVYAKLQQRPLDPADYEGGDLFQDAWRALPRLIEDSGAEIEVGALGPIRADRMLMVEALKRILDNSIRYRRPDRAPRITVTAVEDADWVVRVADNGIGLAPDQYEKVFRMFYSLGRDADEACHGMGLTISRRIVRRHGGDLRFVDCAEGTCLELRLPAGEAPQ